MKLADVFLEVAQRMPAIEKSLEAAKLEQAVVVRTHLNSVATALLEAVDDFQSPDQGWGGCRELIVATQNLDIATAIDVGVSEACSADQLETRALVDVLLRAFAAPTTLLIDLERRGKNELLIVAEIDPRARSVWLDDGRKLGALEARREADFGGELRKLAQAALLFQQAADGLRSLDPGASPPS